MRLVRFDEVWRDNVGTLRTDGVFFHNPEDLPELGPTHPERLRLAILYLCDEYERLMNVPQERMPENAADPQQGVVGVEGQMHPFDFFEQFDRPEGDHNQGDPEF